MMEYRASSVPVYIVMAIFQPDQDYLRLQLQSLANQSHQNFRLICVISDTKSADMLLTFAKAEGLHPELVCPETELDLVRAFEAGLYRAVAMSAEAGDCIEEPLIALCDQDDVWHSDRLARGVAELVEGKADLVHSDAILIDKCGKKLTQKHQSSMFAYERRHKNPGLRGLLYRNNITGMTSMFRLRLAKIALPFPRQSGVHFYHDLWLGLLASSMGGVKLIRAPLVDYRQHGANAVGAVGLQGGWFDRIRNVRLGKAASQVWLRRKAAAYGLARYLAHEAHHRLSQAGADGPLRADDLVNVAPLRPFMTRFSGAGLLFLDALKLILSGHLRLAGIAAGFSVVSIGRSIWALRRMPEIGLYNGFYEFDARLYSLSVGVEPHYLETPPSRTPTEYKALTDARKIPRWTPEFSAPAPALAILVPTLNPTEVFAGILTAVDIGLAVAAKGVPVRFIATDLPVSSQDASLGFLISRLPCEVHAKAAAKNFSIECGVQGKPLPAHPDDVFLATAWWSAHVADRQIRHHGFTAKKFYYLIQDYEPHFYPWGAEYADAMASYALDFEPIFNSSLLREYFADKGFDFAEPEALTFHPSINISQYATGQRPERPGALPRLVLYGRPEIARNLYPTAIEALSHFLNTEAIRPEQIELVSVGMKHASVKLPGGHKLKSLGKLPLEEYTGFLLNADIGLSLMYSPHPSHVPLEMAAAGMRVVTNHFGAKNLSIFSPAILSAEATPEALAAALSQAWSQRTTPIPEGDRRLDLGLLGLKPKDVAAKLAQKLRPQLLQNKE